MRVGLNLLFLRPGAVGGMEMYARGLLSGLLSEAPEHEYVVFLSRDAANWEVPLTSRATRIVCSVFAKNRARRYLFEQCVFPALLRKAKVDLVHSLGYVGPVMTSSPRIVTIPDCNFIDIAATIPMTRRIALRAVTSAAARTANAVVTISEFSKGRICSLMNVPPHKISVTHLAPFLSGTDRDTEAWSVLRSKYGIREPYIVAFGGGAVHKNIPTLLKAFRLLGDDLGHSLVIMGHVPPDATTWIPEDRGKREVVATGFVPEDHAMSILTHASVFVLPSRYEGFGLPILEAQKAGVPAVCSTAGSIPEIAGAGACYFDPDSADGLASVVERVIREGELRLELVQRGGENLARYSWQNTARKTLEVYNTVHEETKRHCVHC